MWAPGGPPGPAGWDRRRVGARLRAALAGLHELQGLRARQQARVRGALAMQPPPAPAAPRGPRAREQRLEAALAALQEQLVRRARGARGVGRAGRGWAGRLSGAGVGGRPSGFRFQTSGARRPEAPGRPRVPKAAGGPAPQPRRRPRTQTSVCSCGFESRGGPGPESLSSVALLGPHQIPGPASPAVGSGPWCRRTPSGPQGRMGSHLCSEMLGRAAGNGPRAVESGASSAPQRQRGCGPGRPHPPCPLCGTRAFSQRWGRGTMSVRH